MIGSLPACGAGGGLAFELATLGPKLLLLRGVDDPTNPPEYEKEVHEAVPGSRYVRLAGAGHFPPTELPDRVNALIQEFVAAL